MSTTIRIPELGEGVDQVEVVAVLVTTGDTIEIDQPLIEVETDKAAVEVPATAAGTVTEVHVEAGASLGPDAPIVTVEADDSNAESSQEDEEAIGFDPTETQPIEAPKLDPSDTAAGTEAGTASASASAAGTAAMAGTAAVAETATIDGGSDQRQQTETVTAAPVEPEIHNSKFIIQNSPAPPVPAAPTVRRFAREVGIDLTTVTGSGHGGRISIDDVKTEANRLLTRTAAPSAAPVVELPDFSRWGDVRREPMTKVRKLTAAAMSRAWQTAPQVTNHDLADITELEDLRRAFKARVETAGGKLTMTAILIKVAASALKLFPTLNASVDASTDEIVFKDYINIGVAVDTEHGLLVPVVKNADRKNITEIAVELDDLATRARKRRLKPDEMQGGTFSISNLGGIGGTGFSPIVNWPEVAILGVSRGRIQPEWDDEIEDFEPRRMLPLSLSYDHRLVDGAEAARFLRWLTEALEQPLLLALEG